MSYVPLLTLLLTVGGCALSLWWVEAPAPPQVVSTLDFMPLTRRSGRTALGRRPVTTPPGDPSLFADVRCCRYVRPPEYKPRPSLRSPVRVAPGPSPAAVARAAWRADVAPFIPPAPVLFNLQEPTPATDEHETAA